MGVVNQRQKDNNLSTVQGEIARVDGVSCVICCYNSAERLPETLDCLARQEVPAGMRWELILVDNCCTDNTVEVAKSCWSGVKDTPLRIVLEDRPGLANARMKGMDEARFEIISFIDDDNLVCLNWIATVFELMTQNNHVGACGGQSEARFPSVRPLWFERFQNYYAIGAPAVETGDLPKTSILWGAGFSIRKTAWQRLRQLGFLFKLRGRCGKKASSSEDTELCLALLLTGWTLRYDARLKLIHVMHSDRMRIEYLIALLRNNGAASTALDGYFRLLEQNSVETNQRKSWLRQAAQAWLIWIYNDIRIFIIKLIRRNYENDDEYLNRLHVMELCRGRWQSLLRSRGDYDKSLDETSEFFQRLGI